MRFAVSLLAAFAFIADAGADGLFGHLLEPGVLRVDQVIGTRVVAPDGTPIGSIEEVLYDPATGKAVEVGVQGERYPVNALLSGDKSGEVVVDQPASAGASTLMVSPRVERFSRAAHDALVDLTEGLILKGPGKAAPE